MTIAGSENITIEGTGDDFGVGDTVGSEIGFIVSNKIGA